MITLKNLTHNTECIIKPTVFPDGTQQVWKLDDKVFKAGDFSIVWHYEGDQEFVTLCQLSQLLSSLPKYDANYKTKFNKPKLIVPFFPYGRQDKEIENSSTFGLHTAMLMLSNTFEIDTIQTFDLHSTDLIRHTHIRSLDVNPQIKEALELSNANLVCFPDAGAAKRGYNLGGIPSFHLSKTRDQSTGNITGMVCDLPLNLDGKTILIVDDICDGGKTFREASKILKAMNAASVQLYVTHGIFSMGVHALKELDHIYTTDSYKTKANLTDKVTVLKLDI